MNENKTEQALLTDAELEDALAQMAEEVPPMPADFHDRWMGAVRAETRKSAPAAEKEAPERSVSLGRWTRILSIAAVFVFLVGGTILYRGAGRNLSDPAVKENKAAAVLSAGANEAAPGAEKAAEAAGSDYADMEAEAEEAESMDAVYETAEEPEETAEAVYGAKAPGSAPASVGAARKSAESEADSAPVMSMVQTEAYEAAAPEPEAAGNKPATKAAAGLAVSTLEPQETAEPEAEAETPVEGAGFLRETGAFFADMGRFLLAALPYLAVLAVPAAITLALRRRKKG